MKNKQVKLTKFFKKPKLKATPRKILLKISGVKGLIAEQIEGGKINLFIEDHGRQRLISILEIAQFKAIISIPQLELSPKRLAEILPDIPQKSILLLNEAMLVMFRESTNDSSL